MLQAVVGIKKKGMRLKKLFPLFHLHTLYAFSGMFCYRCYSGPKNLQWEVLAIREIPSKFPSQMINSSKNQKK